MPIGQLKTTYMNSKNLKTCFFYLCIVFISLNNMSLFAQSGNLVSSGEKVIFSDVSLNTSTIWQTVRSATPSYFSVVGNTAFIDPSDAHNINGYVKHYANAANQSFNFTVGTGADFRNLSISGSIPSNSVLGVAWIAGNPSITVDPTSPSSGTHDVSSKQAFLSDISTVGQWDWQDISGNNTGVTVTVSIPDLTAYAPASLLRLAGWDGTQWVDLSGTSTASGNTENSTLSGTTVSNITAIGISSFNDSDEDGIADVDDQDSDNDGILDIDESGGNDPFGDEDGDGIFNWQDTSDNGSGGDGSTTNYTDADGNGIPDVYDTDGDGIPNHVDLDSDNDGIPDIVEAGGVDADGDGRVDVFVDTDGDGWANTFDSDNGGTPLTKPDSDNDGIDDYLDLDSDNDGIADVVEAGGIDANRDGQIDGIDADFNGLIDLVDGNSGGTPLADYDIDSDGLPNRLDIDSDNDGLIDNIESQSTASFVAPSGIDTDGDGWDNQYDTDNGGSVIEINNQDGTDNPDYTDFDTDGDGQPDWIEGFDDDQNGDALNDFLARAANFTAAGGNANFYDNMLDDDADLIPNWLEDSDLDAQPNFLDPDSPYYHDTDNDGLIDLYDLDNFGTASILPNKDADLEPDWRDADNATTLPITLLTFDAEKKVEDVLLTWITLSEINNDYFTVEKSKDGIYFIELDKVAGAGNSNEKLTYNLIDHSPYNGVSYYRLKQTDFNGDYSYSELKAIDFGEQSKSERFFTVFPNPSTSEVLGMIVSIKLDKTFTITIKSVGGQLISTQTVNQQYPKNSRINILPSKPLAKGSYIISLIINNSVIDSQTIIIE